MGRHHLLALLATVLLTGAATCDQPASDTPTTPSTERRPGSGQPGEGGPGAGPGGPPGPAGSATPGPR